MGGTGTKFWCVTRSIEAAAAIEAATGPVLISSPSAFTRLVLGAELDRPGQALGRFAGGALLALALACGPGAEGGSETAPALRALLALNVLVASYLLYLGIGGELVGVLLWPAAILHAVVATVLACAWLGISRRGSET
jgi:hypothetical protein